MVPATAIPSGRFVFRFGYALLAIFALAPALPAQRPGPGASRPQQTPTIQSVSLVVNIRDARGVPLDVPAIVQVSAAVGSYNITSGTHDAGSATFDGLSQGDYDIVATCPGYQDATEHVSVYANLSPPPIYLYMTPVGEKPASPAHGVLMSPKLQAEIDKGVVALRKHQFDAARAHFLKGVQLAPGNPDIHYLLGTAELGLGHVPDARKCFEDALQIDPAHERALLALGELQLRNNEVPEAIATVEKAFQKNGASWRTHFLLASAYAKAGRLKDAEKHARRAMELAQNKGADCALLLGEIEAREGEIEDARRTWKSLIQTYAGTPEAQQAKDNLTKLSIAQAETATPDLSALPIPTLANPDMMPPTERPWAPPDIEDREYSFANNAPCQAEEILPLAEKRLKAQLENFEKFTATEHIEHQDVDRYGHFGPVRSRDFSYIVFVHSYQNDSFFLDEDRYSPSHDPAFPTSLATIGLNNLGVSILQPATRNSFMFRCEGLTSARDKAVWQIHFVEKQDSKHGIREWQRNGSVFHVPLKGRLWISSASFDLIRIETNVREPIEPLALTMDHLIVDYGPVNFAKNNTTLWLPWSAEMYMELHGRRYHHKHYLTDYLLFGVDTKNRIGKPKEPPPTSAEGNSPGGSD